MEQGEEKTCLKSFPQVFNKQMGVVMMVVMVMMAQEGEDTGMAPTIVQLSSQRVDVMCAATWWRPPLSTRITSRGGSQYMDTMFIFLLHRKTSFVGSSTAVRTPIVTYSMLEAQRMCVRGGPAPRKHAWTVTVLELDFTNISRMGVQVEMEGEILSIYGGQF